MPRVSVIIPTYNRADLLGEAVASVIAQTYKDYEIIIVDDGSTDNTKEVASHFPPEIRYVQKTNGGAASARNKGIELARGEYLCFVDSDDALLENALETNVNFLDSHPDVGLCYGQVCKMDEDGRLLKLRKLRGAKTSGVRESSEQITRLLFRGDIAMLAVLVRRSCFEKVGCFDTSVPYGEDIDMWLRIAMEYKVGYIAEPLGKVRIHVSKTNLTNRGKFDIVESSQIEFMTKALNKLKDIPDYKRIKKKAYFGLYCYLSGEAARKSRPGTGVKYFFKALTVYPEMAVKGEGISFLVAAARGFLPRTVLGAGKKMAVALKLR